MSVEIELAGAIAGLVAEKRALGYKYVCEERALARFDAFCASEFPEPPDVVRAIQEAINWLARAVIELDEDSIEAPTALAEALARLLAVWVFTEIARDGGASD